MSLTYHSDEKFIRDESLKSTMKGKMARNIQETQIIIPLPPS